MVPDPINKKEKHLIMNNIELLFARNNPKKMSQKAFVAKFFNQKKKRFEFKNNSHTSFYQGIPVFDDGTIKDILDFLNLCFYYYPSFKMPIVFDMGRVYLGDKLVYTIFECICYYLVTHGYRIKLLIDVAYRDMWTEGIITSPLRDLNGATYDLNKFIDDFSNGFNNIRHYRRIIPGDIDLESNYLGDLEDDIVSFFDSFKNADDSGRFAHIDDSVEELCSMIGELVGNSCEHVRADVLIDIDVTSEYDVTPYKYLCEHYNIDPDYWYCGINVVLLNFSSQSVYDRILEKMLFINDSDKEMARYRDLQQAFDFHSEHFSEAYTQEDFYTMSAFQYKISGRIEERELGGTGLTQVIRCIEDKIAGMCYVMSGHSILDFKQEFLEMNDDMWVGFNKEKDFIGALPNDDVCLQSRVFFPGTAYNLTFMIRGEKK